MIIDSINLNNLRVFESVYRKRSMTKAAEEMHLTQSGISQHVKSLEDMLNVKLFDRINHLLIPTNDAVMLYNQCNESFGRIEDILLKIKGEQGELAGRVNIGMPVEFGRNVILPLMIDFGKKHQRVGYNIKFGGAFIMNDLLLKGEVDFAFIDEFIVDPKITTEIVYPEALDLYIHKNYLAKNRKLEINQRYFEELDYVDYVEDGAILKKWFNRNLGIKNIKLNIRTSVFDVRAIARFILSGFGAGVLPSHRVSILGRDAKNLHCFKIKNRKLINKISIAKINGRTFTPAVSSLFEFLTEKLRKSKDN